MPKIALLWDNRILFERFFTEHGFNHQLVHPASIGSPYLPSFNMMIIPTGFANPQYSGLLPKLLQHRRRIANFVNNGGTLLVYGPLVPSHSYEWLPVDIQYVRQYGPVELSRRSSSEASLLANDSSLECDGYFGPSIGECVLANHNDEPVLLKIEYGRGLIIATSIHEYPTPEFIRWALERSASAVL